MNNSSKEKELKHTLSETELKHILREIEIKHNSDIEIELKFIPVNVKALTPEHIINLLENDDNFTIISSENYRQEYLSEGELVNRVRIVNNNEAFYTCKSKSKDADGLERDEVEFPIPLDSARKLANMSLFGLEKTRYKFLFKKNTETVFELDVYKNKLKNLLTLEVELDSVDKAKSFKLPEPLSDLFVDVTSVPAYSNFSLAKNGLKTKDAKKTIKPN